MRKWTKISIFSAVGVALTAGIIALPFSLSLVGKNQFVFGNFQSYMAPSVMNNIQNKYDVNWQYYGTNAEIPTYIKNKTLNAAVATNNMIAQLALQKEIQPINWAEFHLWNTKENKPVEGYWDLKGIVSDVIWNLCQQVADEINLPGLDGHQPNLLEYCVPYFLQDFVFAYRGTEIPQLQENSSFYQIFNYITGKNNNGIEDKNDELNNRFLGSNSKVMMIKDARTVYDVSKLIEADKNNVPSEKINVNPGWTDNLNNTGKPGSDYIMNTNNLNGSDAPSISDLVENYDIVSNYYKGLNPNTITLNTDSSIVLNKLANNEIKGAFLYNGDAIYSASGGDNASNSPNLPNFNPNYKGPNEFHVVIPKNNFLAMDGIVFNSSISGNILKKAYDIAYDVSLSGLPCYKVNENGEPIDEKGNVIANPKDPSNYKKYVILNNDINSQDINTSIGDENKDGDYKFDSMANFDFVNYTPCYQNLLTYATKIYFGPVEATNGITQQEAETETKLHELQAKLLNINYTKSEMEGKVDLPVNELTESNMNMAFETFNQKI